MSLVQKIKEVREAKKLSQAEVANTLNMERSNYHRLENRGEKLTIEQLESIAGALGVPVVELLTGEPQTGQNDERVKELEKQLDELDYLVSRGLNDIVREKAEKSRTGKIWIAEYAEDADNYLSIDLKEIPKDKDIDNWIEEHYPYYQYTYRIDLTTEERALFIQKILKTNSEFDRLLQAIELTVGLSDTQWSKERRKLYGKMENIHFREQDKKRNK